MFAVIYWCLLKEMDNYVSCGEEIIVKDMHTRKKMIFDMVCV